MLGGAVQYAGFQRLLGPRLKDPDPASRRSALVGWARFAVAWQLVVVAIAVAWIATALLRHASGWWWAAPPIGLLLGTALPLQLVVMAVSRSAARP